MLSKPVLHHMPTTLLHRFLACCLHPFCLLLTLLAAPALAAPLQGSQAAEGLKALLDQGSELAIRQLGQPGGFNQNPQWRIPLPDSLQTPAKVMRSLGQGAVVDDLENNLNAAAEQAIPHARELLVNSIRQISLQDARDILSGHPTAATEYLDRTSRDELRQRFLPIVHETTADSPLIQQYNQLAGQVSGLGLSLGKSKKPPQSAEEYVADKALDALFGVLGEQEANLRANPTQAAGSLLQAVLGGLRK